MDCNTVIFSTLVCHCLSVPNCNKKQEDGPWYSWSYAGPSAWSWWHTEAPKNGLCWKDFPKSDLHQNIDFLGILPPHKHIHFHQPLKLCMQNSVLFIFSQVLNVLSWKMSSTVKQSPEMPLCFSQLHFLSYKYFCFLFNFSLKFFLTLEYWKKLSLKWTKNGIHAYSRFRYC